MSDKEKERWKKRPNKEDEDYIWRLAEPRLWITVGNSEETVEDSSKFTQLRKTKAFELIKSVVQPQNTALNKDGTFSIQVLNSEVPKLLNTKAINEVKVSFKKHPHLNKVRGEIYHIDLKELSSDEIKESLAEYNCTDAFIKKNSR